MLVSDTRSSGGCLPHALVILLIPTLFLLAMVAGYFGIMPLRVEGHTLAITGFIYLVFILFVRHNANYAVCKLRSGFSRMEDTLHQALRANALTIMGKTKSTLTIRDFFADYHKDLRNDNFAKVAPSVFPMLGILGTFVAIAVSMPDFRATDIGALDREISVLLSGIGTAFYASIYGILLSLVWLYFEKRGLSKVDRIIHDMEKLYDARIWKRSELVKHEHMQNAMREQETVQTLKEIFNLDFIRELNEQYLNNFTKIMETASSHYSELTQKMQHAATELRATLEAIHTRQENIDAVRAMRENIEAFTQSAKQLEARIAELDKLSEARMHKIDEALAQSVEKLATFARVVAEQNRTLFDELEQLKRRHVS